MALFELDDVFTYQDANDIKRLWAATSAPTVNVATGEIWLDISNSPYKLKRYNGDSWEIVSDVTAQEVLDLIKTVDGSGSGLDSDKLDGQDSSYYRNASNLNAGTLPLDRLPSTLTGKDADTVDGVNASQFVRSDINDEISGHTEWQDGFDVRLGNGADFRASHNGTDTTLYNYNGNLYIMNLAPAKLTHLGGYDSGSNWRTLLTLNAEQDLVTGRIARSALVELWRDNNTDETTNPYIQTGNTNGTGDDDNQYKLVTFDIGFTSTPKLWCNAVDSLSANHLINDVTTTTFTLHSRYANIWYDWLAIGKK